MTAWSCEAFASRVDDWARGVELVPPEALAHATACDACRAQWGRAQRVAAATRALARHAERAVPSPQLRDRLQERAEATLGSRKTRERREDGLGWPLLAWGLAAAVVLAVVGAGVGQRAPDVRTPAPGPTAVAEARPDADVLTTADARAAQRVAELAPVVDPPAPSPGDEDTYDAGLTVVPVALGGPGDALAAAWLGAAWPDGGDDTELTAELLVDADGVARAVRLVPTVETVSYPEEESL